MLSIISFRACLRKPSMIFQLRRSGPRTIKRGKKLERIFSRRLSQGLAGLVICLVVLLIALIALLLTRPRSGFEKGTKQFISHRFHAEPLLLGRITNRG